MSQTKNWRVVAPKSPEEQRVPIKKNLNMLSCQVSKLYRYETGMKAEKLKINFGWGDVKSPAAFVDWLVSALDGVGSFTLLQTRSPSACLD